MARELLRRPRSIQGSLLLWFGALLAIVIAAFGSWVYLDARSATEQRIDSHLTATASAILAALDNEEDEGWELELSRDYLDGLTQGGYFAVWDEEGRVLVAGGQGAPARPGVHAGLATIGSYRQIVRSDARGARLIVAADIADEQAQLSRLTWTLAGIGALVLALGIAGGAWIARRSIGPVAEVSIAATRIDESCLAERLKVDGLPAELQGVVSAFNDILDRLQAAFERQARFTADASHELRTPVTLVRTESEQTLRRERSPEAYRDALQRNLAAAIRMTGIVEGLMTLARFDAGAASLANDVVRLDGLIEEAVAPYREERAFSLELVAGTVRGDAALLREVVTNLISNAVRYGAAEAPIRVRLTAMDDELRLEVHDEGEGIPKSELPRVFERFYRVDPARSRDRGGSGLGLAICHSIVRAHGGDIVAESEPGQGTTFIVRLPRAEEGPRVGEIDA